MANEFTIPGTFIGGGKASFGILERTEVQILNDLEVTSTGNASIGIFTGAANVGSYNFGTGVTSASANIDYNHSTTLMRLVIGSTPELSIDASGGTTVTTIAADMVVSGDLTVSGTTTTVNSTDLNVTDNIILLNKDEVGAGVTLGAAGIEIERGSLDNSGWYYNETKNWWGPTGPSGTFGVGIGATQTIGNVAIIDSTLSTDEVLTINGTGAIKIPTGITAERPTGIDGMVRYNSTSNNLEAFIAGIWEELLSTGSSVTISGDLSMDPGFQIFLDDGTAANPGLTFVNDPNTGLFRVGADTLGFSAGGLAQLTINTTTINGQANELTNIANPSTGAGVGDRDFNDGRYIQDTGGTLNGNLTINHSSEALTIERTTTGPAMSVNLNKVSVVGEKICIDFIMQDDAAASVSYGRICTEIVDDTTGFVEGKMRFLLQDGTGTIATAAILNADGIMEVTATAALYSDLAERYAADMDLEPGTVVVFGGEAEITISSLIEDTAVAGIISTNPAFRMNEGAGENKTHPYVALKGRIPCKVTGLIKKGDLLVTSQLHGHAMSIGKQAKPYTAFARALENFDGETGTIEVAII